MTCMSYMAVLILGGIMTVVGWQYATTLDGRGFCVSMPWLSRFWMYFPVPLAGVAMIVFEIETLYNHIKSAGMLLSLQSVGNLVAILLMGYLPVLWGRRRSVPLTAVWMSVDYLLFTTGIGGAMPLPAACLMTGISKGGNANLSNTMISILHGKKAAIGYNLLHGAYAVGRVGMIKKGRRWVFYDDAVAVSGGIGVTRRVLAYCDQVMCVENTFERGVGHLHSHPHTQLTYAAEGTFSFTIDGETKIVRKGDTLLKENGVVHGCVCLEEGILVDIFTPMREDFV